MLPLLYLECYFAFRCKLRTFLAHFSISLVAYVLCPHDWMLHGSNEKRQIKRHRYAVPHPFPFLPQESICAAQLITEDEGLGRLAHTVQVLVDLAPTAASHRRASRPEPLGADRPSTAPSSS